MEWLNFIDIDLFKLINSSGFNEVDCFMQWISNKFFWIPLYLYLIYLIYKKFSEDFLKILFSLGILIFLADYGSVNLFKENFQRLRPCHSLELESLRLVGDLDIEIVFSKKEYKDWVEKLFDLRLKITSPENCGGLYGFISSHASNSFALAFFLGLIFRNARFFAFLFSWAVIIGFSRIYLGVHYPFDIVGGMFWGLFVSLLVYKLLKLKLNEAV